MIEMKEVDGIWAHICLRMLLDVERKIRTRTNICPCMNFLLLFFPWSQLLLIPSSSIKCISSYSYFLNFFLCAYMIKKNVWIYIHIRKNMVLIMFKNIWSLLLLLLWPIFLHNDFLYMHYVTSLPKFGNIYAFNNKRRSKYENLALMIWTRELRIWIHNKFNEIWELSSFAKLLF